jgi:hypothetical protein
MDCLLLIIDKDANAQVYMLYLSVEIGIEVLGLRLMVSPLIMGGERSFKVEYAPYVTHNHNIITDKL